MTRMSNNAHKKAPPQRLIKALSCFGLFILIAFPLGMLFVGFSALEVNCARKQTGEPPDCEMQEVRLFGLFRRRAKEVDRFLKTPDESTLALHTSERNIFGWFGVAYLGFFAMSYASWFVRKLTGRA